MVAQLMPADFAVWRNAANAAGVTPMVLDVREAWELQVASLAAQHFTLRHVPMQSIPTRLAELQQLGTDHPIACLCHHGIRSLQVANFLAHHGFTNVVNLQGGIDAWAQQVDANIPHY